MLRNNMNFTLILTCPFANKLHDVYYKRIVKYVYLVTVLVA